MNSTDWRPPTEIGARCSGWACCVTRARASCGHYSLLPSRFLLVEHAVRVILSQTSLPDEVLEQVTARGFRDGVAVPRDVTERIDDVFFDDW